MRSRARALVERQRTSIVNEPIPVPKSLGDLVRHRLGGLSPEARDVGRLVAASADPRERLIRSAYGASESWAAIDQAIDDGIIYAMAGHVRTSLVTGALESVRRGNPKSGRQVAARRHVCGVAGGTLLG